MVFAGWGFYRVLSYCWCDGLAKPSSVGRPLSGLFVS